MLKLWKYNAQTTQTDFLVKSALGLSLVGATILIPFCINNFVHGREVAGSLTGLVALLCLVNAFYCYKGRYILALNLIGLMPAITIGITDSILNLGVIGTYWCFLGVFAIYFILPFHYAKWFNFIYLVAAIWAANTSIPPDLYMRFSAVLLGTSFFIMIAVREIFSQQEQLRTQSITDPLTEAFNRGYLSTSLNQAISEFNEDKSLSTLCILDIDHFKKINDHYGHDIGDKVLVKLSALLRNYLSGKDMLFRIGGEEFLLLMKDTSEEEGYLTAEAIRAVVEETEFIQDHPVTISIGVTQIAKGNDWKKWMKLSDEKLYLAKSNGRNQTVC
ncbi:GGDEF domain-containing protein [Glaciecola sp. MH2013]|uniref:GGDEF domain-containing protein n=1 Tax=Glaciecola sp. MH2013 TaxID=2785524 RepID=UPI00189E28D9|nr:GGDEF domain-containing protein [Glaciecola sp. MH2013]MBF7073619.1 GGDEF domain-containing protein [Glaciecola sp. MH2013]